MLNFKLVAFLRGYEIVNFKNKNISFNNRGGVTQLPVLFCMKFLKDKFVGPIFCKSDWLGNFSETNVSMSSDHVD